MATNYLALDVGTVRIGLARAASDIKIASALPAIQNDDAIFRHLQATIAAESTSQLVVGLPRGLDGQETAQTRYVLEFLDQLSEAIGLPVALQDEALTSVKAEAELKQRGTDYSKGDVDSLSAVYILEDYLLEGVH